MKSGMYDAVVLGAGIAGACLAYSLAKRGWNVLLLDRRTGSAHKACGEFLSPEARHSLRGLGLEKTVDRLVSEPIHKVSLHSSGGAALEWRLAAPSVGVSRQLLDEALRTEATKAGANWLGGATALSVRAQPGGYRVRVRNQAGVEAELEARTVFGSWGRNGSPALAGKTSDRAQRSFRGVGWKVHARGLETRQAVELYFFKGGYVGLAPIGDGLTNAAALVEFSTAQKAPKGTLGWLKLAAESNPAFARRFEGALPLAETERAAAPIRTSDKAAAWRDYPLLGDAALIIPPLCGDGMAMALRSAEACAPLADAYLRGEISMEGWKSEYVRLVKEELEKPAKWGRRLQSCLIHPPVARLLLSLGAASPKLAHAAFRATRLALPAQPT